MEGYKQEKFYKELLDKLDSIQQTLQEKETTIQDDEQVIFKFNNINNRHALALTNHDNIFKLLDDLNSCIRELDKYGCKQGYYIDTVEHKYYTPEEIISLEEDDTFFEKLQEKNRFIKVMPEHLVVSKLEDLFDEYNIHNLLNKYWY